MVLYRELTHIGMIAAIKILALSMLIQSLTVLPISPELGYKINTKYMTFFFLFLWTVNNDKVKRTAMDIKNRA